MRFPRRDRSRHFPLGEFDLSGSIKASKKEMLSWFSAFKTQLNVHLPGFERVCRVVGAELSVSTVAVAP